MNYINIIVIIISLLPIIIPALSMIAIIIILLKKSLNPKDNSSNPNGKTATLMYPLVCKGYITESYETYGKAYYIDPYGGNHEISFVGVLAERMNYYSGKEIRVYVSQKDYSVYKTENVIDILEEREILPRQVEEVTLSDINMESSMEKIIAEGTFVTEGIVKEPDRIYGSIEFTTPEGRNLEIAIQDAHVDIVKKRAGKKIKIYLLKNGLYAYSKRQLFNL